jgi:hypothetical protein
VTIHFSYDSKGMSGSGRMLRRDTA